MNGTKMKREYEYGFIDGSIILHRNFCAMKRFLTDEGSASLLVQSFIRSIFKIARENLKCERYFILWDKTPYHKVEILKSHYGKSEYKADRAKIKDNLLAIMGKAKYIIITELGNLGMTSVMYPGWEADDLAYMVSQQVLGRPKKSVLISFDSDWYSWVDKNTDYYNVKQNTVYTYDSIVKAHPLVKGCSLFYSKAIRDSLRGSHNNLKNILKPEFNTIKCRDVLAMMELDDYSFSSNPELFKAQLATFDFTTYPDYNKVSTFLSYYVTKGKLGSKDDFKKFKKSNNIKSMKDDAYEVFRSSCTKSKWE